MMRFAYVISMSGVGITSSPVSFPIWPDDSSQTDQRKNENKNYCYKKTKKKVARKSRLKATLTYLHAPALIEHTPPAATTKLAREKIVLNSY